MKKIIIISIIVCVLLITSFYFLSRKPKVTGNNQTQSTISQPIEKTEYQKGPSITTTDPLPNAKNVSTGTSIIVLFNKPPELSDLTISFLPEVQIDTLVENNTLIITPRSALKPDTTYTYSIISSATNIKRTFAFSTLKANESPPPDSSSKEVFELRQKYELENEPDLYLYNLLPINETSFSVESEYVREPTGHFKFTITLKGDTTRSKESFIEWLKVNKLSDQQIQTLDIVYQ